MPGAALDQALKRLNALEHGEILSPPDVEVAIFEILSAAGYAVTAPQPFHQDDRIDMRLDGRIEGKRERVGVEVKAHRGHVSGQTIYRALDVLRTHALDRILIIGLGGFSPLARERAALERIGKVDLLDTRDLRDWLLRHAVADEPPSLSIKGILKAAMRALAARLSVAPEEIYDVEWRDMERLLGEVFETLGFETKVTPSAKDGGYDVRLADREGRVFLVEVKHWLTTVGSGVIKRLVEVTARENASAGILLATGGFAPSLFDGLIELQAQTIHLGDGGKIASLCRAFYRAETQLWQADDDLVDLLLSETTLLHPEFGAGPKNLGAASPI